MDTYSWLRQLADSWVLLALTLFYLGAIVWVFRPGSRKLHDEAASIPFRHAAPDAGCGRTCSDCACSRAAKLIPEGAE